jgi:hypothetical protein
LCFLRIEYQNEFTTKGGKFHDVVQAVMAETGSTFQHGQQSVQMFVSQVLPTIFDSLLSILLSKCWRIRRGLRTLLEIGDVPSYTFQSLLARDTRKSRSIHTVSCTILNAMRMYYSSKQKRTLQRHPSCPLSVHQVFLLESRMERHLQLANGELAFRTK